MAYLEGTEEIPFLTTSNTDPIVDLLINDTYGNGTNETGLEHCEYLEPPLTNIRFWIVTVFGSLVSVISVSENLFLFFLLLSRKYHRTSYNVYLMLLAFFDVFVSFAYVFLMSVNVLSDYLHSPFLVKLWMSYMIPMITISHIAITSSSFLILAATFERYCITINSHRLPLVQKNRKWIAFIAVLFGVVSKGTMYFEFAISQMPECSGLMTEMALGFEDFVFATPYHTYWRFWYRNFVTIFFPFFMLAYFNIRIVKALSHQQKQSCADLINNTIEQSKRKKTTRSATRTMILVVCCYLISNIMNVLLTIWEHVDKTSLAEKYDSFYALALDFVSLATNLSCACRVPIYLACQAPIRKEFFYTLKQWIQCRSAERRCQNLSPQTPGSPENVCLINSHATDSTGISESMPANGVKRYSANHDSGTLPAYRASQNGGDRALVSSFHEDQQSTSSSFSVQNEIFKRFFWGSPHETLL